MKKDENILESSYEPCPKCNDDPCPICGKTNVETNDKYGWDSPDGYEERQQIIKEVDDLTLALEHQDLTEDERAKLIIQYAFSRFSLINSQDLDGMQFMYAGMLQFYLNTSKQNEVLRLKLKRKTEEEIAGELNISRRAVRERMELVQKKGEKAMAEAKSYTDREVLRMKIIEGHPSTRGIYNTIKELYEADELLKKNKGNHPEWEKLGFAGLILTALEKG